MSRSRACGTLVAIAAAVMAASAQQPVFRGTGDAVHVYVTVTDGDGRLVTTLARDEFEIRDEGNPQAITLFDNTPQPIRLVVMLDVSGSMEGNLGLLRTASDQLFSRLRPDDVVRVGSFGHEIVISPQFTRNTDELRRGLPTAIAPDAPTPLWRAIDEALAAFGTEGGARPVILVLSDGKDSGPLSLTQRYVSQVDVIDRARAADVMIYAIGMRSRGQRNMPPGIGRERPAGDVDGRSSRSRAGAGRAGNRRRILRNSIRSGPRRRVYPGGRRTAQPISDWVRSTQTRRQGPRYRCPDLAARVDRAGP